MIDTSTERHSNASSPVYRHSALPATRRDDIPPAFYRDGEPPPPPPDDPHWFEWSHDKNEPVPRWLAYGLPALLLFATVCHFLLLLLVLKSPL